MDKYQVKSNGRAPFKLLKETQELGVLNYPNLYSTTKAEILITGRQEKLEIKTPGFWKNNLELLQEGSHIAYSKLGWDLSVALCIQDSHYQLRVKDLSKGIFTLQNEQREELMQIEANMNWLQAKAEFEIELWRNPELFSPEILLFMVHNCNYFLALSGNSSEASTATSI
jgi:hypothetical protein